MHSIRLRGPWECCLPGSAESRTVTMPARWDELTALALNAGPLPCSVSLLRRFGLPTGIEPGDQLWIVIECDELEFQVSLNGQPLVSDASALPRLSYRVPALAPRNELKIRLEIPKLEAIAAPDACPVRDVCLEIVAG
jgi:hypothetical protein